MSAEIEITIDELHAQTDRYVREAAEKRIVITDHGKPVAELQPAAAAVPSGNPWRNRELLPAFRALEESGKLLHRSGKPDSTEFISQDRDRGQDW